MGGGAGSGMNKAPLRRPRPRGTVRSVACLTWRAHPCHLVPRSSARSPNGSASEGLTSRFTDRETEAQGSLRPLSGWDFLELETFVPCAFAGCARASLGLVLPGGRVTSRAPGRQPLRCTVTEGRRPAEGPAIGIREPVPTTLPHAAPRSKQRDTRPGGSCVSAPFPHGVLFLPVRPPLAQ